MATHRPEEAHEAASRCPPASIGVELHVAAAEPGFALARASPPPTATQGPAGRQETPLRATPGSIVRPCQAPPPGLSEPNAAPRPSTATHDEVLEQATAWRALPSTLAVLQLADPGLPVASTWPD
jgi:hypothetical protein